MHTGDFPFTGAQTDTLYFHVLHEACSKVINKPYIQLMFWEQVPGHT